MVENRCLPRPVRLIVFKNRAGMIVSVSTLIIFNGAATPSSVVNFSIHRSSRRTCGVALVIPLAGRGSSAAAPARHTRDDYPLTSAAKAYESGHIHAVMSHQPKEVCR